MGRRADVLSSIALSKIEELDDKNKNEKFASDVLISLHHTMITMFDSGGKQIAFWGPSNLEESYGIKNLGGDLIITNFLSTEDRSRWEIQINTVFETGESMHGEYPLYFPTGEYWFDMAFSPIWGPRGQVSAVLVMIRDISQLKEKVNELLSMYHDLQLYTSLLRHDLRNDLQVILAETEISELKESDESQLIQMRDTVKASAERMARVLSAFETNDDIQGYRIVGLFERIAHQGEKIHQNLRITVSFTPDVQNVKVVGGRLLPMAFDNIIRNASQHAGDNPIVQIWITLDGREAQIDIKDNGPGMSEEIQKIIFQRKQGRGGLGLCKRIIEGCGGSLILLDNQTQGTAFRIKLPLIR